MRFIQSSPGAPWHVARSDGNTTECDLSMSRLTLGHLSEHGWKPAMKDVCKTCDQIVTARERAANPLQVVKTSDYNPAEAQARIQDLLENNTRQVMLRRRADWFAQVRHFFHTMGQPTPPVPCDDNTKAIRLGLELVSEEVFELFGHMAGDLHARDDFEEMAAEFREAWRAMPISKLDVESLALVADDCADIVYVVIGLAIRLGIDLRPVWDLVHTANLQKADGPIDPVSGKRGKPPGFKPPDVLGEIQRQRAWDLAPMYAPKSEVEEVLRLLESTAGAVERRAAKVIRDLLNQAPPGAGGC